MLALAGLLALPATTFAGAGKTPQDLEGKIEELARQLDALKTQLAEQSEAMTEYGEKDNYMDDLM